MMKHGLTSRNKTQETNKLCNELIDGVASLDEHHDTTRFLERRAEFRDGVGADDVRPCRLIGEKLVYFGRRAVVNTNLRIGWQGRSVSHEELHEGDETLAQDEPQTRGHPC